MQGGLNKIMRIDGKNNVCTVIVTVDGDRQAIAGAAEHASAGLQQFKAFAGFLGGAAHLSSDGRRLVQYLQWRDEASHLACMNDPRWANSQSSRLFMQRVEEGRLKLHVGVYRVTGLTSCETNQG